MASLELALDLGSCTARATANKISYIVKEPTLAAVDANDSKVRATGVAAQKMLSNPLMARLKAATPIFEGAVVDKVAARALIKTLIEKCLTRHLPFHAVTVTCFVSPCATKSDKQAIEQVLNTLDVKQTNFVPSVLADATQIFQEFSITSGIICNIGGTKCEIAAIDGAKILSACSLQCGGRAIDKEITSLVGARYGMIIPPQEAERIKHTCGSLFTNDNSAAMCYGVNAQNGSEEQVGIYAREIYNSVAASTANITGAIQSMLTSLPASAKNEGVILCGGGAMLTGIDRFFFDVLKMNVRVAKTPDETTISGAKLLLQHTL